MAENGHPVMGRTMSANATTDHRVIDGFHAARIAGVLREWMANPDAHFDASERDAVPTA